MNYRISNVKMSNPRMSKSVKLSYSTCRDGQTNIRTLSSFHPGGASERLIQCILYRRFFRWTLGPVLRRLSCSIMVCA